MASSDMLYKNGVNKEQNPKDKLTTKGPKGKEITLLKANPEVSPIGGIDISRERRMEILVGKVHKGAVEIEGNCEECGGSGFDPGGVDPWGPEPCPTCRGARTQRVLRNYLAEAFQIAANPECTRPVERHHLVAVIQHCREAVSAIAILPDVA